MLLSFPSVLPLAASVLLLLTPTTVLLLPAHAQQLASRPPFLNHHSNDDIQIVGERHERAKPTAGPPVAVRKMMGNEEEMFFQHFWQFDLEPPKQRKELQPDTVHAPDIQSNASLIFPLEPPVALHHLADFPPSPGHWARRLLHPKLWDRAFQCPTGTDGCTTIDRPDSCCPSGNTCQLVSDTGQGDVACCASGQTCAGKVQDCAPGYQSCPAAAGGGCCVPGYDCVGTVGCAHSSTTTVIVQPQTTASPSTSSSSPQPTTTTTPASTTPAASTSKTTTTTSTTSTSTTSSSPSPPPPPTTTSSNAFLRPARPTSAAIITTHSTSSSSSSSSSCPTGFYQCSAFYHGGCCRIGRDCALTNCPPTSGSTTVASGDGVTVVAPGGGGAAATGTGGCANGWRSCGSDVGGGCCPTGFECGKESCTKGAGAKVTGTEGGVSVGKSVAQEGFTSGGCGMRMGLGRMVVVAVMGGLLCC